jgi:hypothetical protein
MSALYKQKTNMSYTIQMGSEYPSHLTYNCDYGQYVNLEESPLLWENNNRKSEDYYDLSYNEEYPFQNYGGSLMVTQDNLPNLIKETNDKIKESCTYSHSYPYIFHNRPVVSVMTSGYKMLITMQMIYYWLTNRL